MILSKADLTTPNLLRLGEMLMDKSDALSDWLWEECGGDAGGIIPNATLGISIAIDPERGVNTVKMGVVDRNRPVLLANFQLRSGHDINTMWWIPIDEYVGTGGQCTLAEVVDFLGGETYDMILKNPIMLRKLAVDMLKRYQTEGSA